MNSTLLPLSEAEEEHLHTNPGEPAHAKWLSNAPNPLVCTKTPAEGQLLLDQERREEGAQRACEAIEDSEKQQLEQWHLHPKCNEAHSQSTPNMEPAHSPQHQHGTRNVRAASPPSQIHIAVRHPLAHRKTRFLHGWVHFICFAI